MPSTIWVTASLLVALGFLNKISDKGANAQYTYGYKRLSLFGALLNGVVLVVGSVWVLVKPYRAY